MGNSSNIIWFWERVNLIKCVCKSTLITREFVGPSAWFSMDVFTRLDLDGDYITIFHDLSTHHIQAMNLNNFKLF